MKTLKQYMDEAGGVVRCSRDTGVQERTVRYWCQRNSVPEWRISALGKWLRKNGVFVTDNELSTIGE